MGYAVGIILGLLFMTIVIGGAVEYFGVDLRVLLPA